MKKYLLLLSDLELGGAERQAVNFARYLLMTGRSVEVLGLANEGKVKELCSAYEIKCNLFSTHDNVWTNAIKKMFEFTCRIFSFETRKRAFYLAEYVKKNDIDVVISYCANANVLLATAKKYLKDQKCIWFQRDAGIFDGLGRLQKQGIKNVDCVLANSESGRKWLREAYGVESVVIHNGVQMEDAEHSIGYWRRELGIGNEAMVCTMIANLSSAKNHMEILQAWKCMQESARKCEGVLVFAGRFDDKYEELYNYVVENELLETVRFLGPISDVTGLLQASSICVFGAISEGSPNAIIEAMLQELPVVATDLPEIRDVLSYDNCSFLYTRGDIKGAAEKINILLKDSDLRKRLGKSNRAYATEKFSIDRNFELIIKTVENLGRS